ncbi:MAG: alternate F1F0 ATPase, F1 subunit alpha [Gammaproteobacteria bacterium]|nr:alternate F1F0 ATPase, F1 subunit alpha [Gammaproteobacteria bacterium]
MTAPKLRDTVEATLADLRVRVGAQRLAPQVRETGTVIAVGPAVARVSGLPGVAIDELVQFAGGEVGIAFNLDPDDVGVILLHSTYRIRAGDEVRRMGRAVDVPVGEALLGRVIDATGRPLDRRGPVAAAARWPVERDAPPIIRRAPVTVPLATGIKVIDALIPIGRGQRELILGDRQTGKTAIAIDTIVNQGRHGVLCVYCAIGQRDSSVAQVISQLESSGALAHTVVVVAGGEDPPALQYITPYAATSIGEYFMEHGRDVLVVYDDLTRHARAYRELALLLRRPPGREAYPGDIFYVHSRLLERSTHLAPEHGGGSLTALPILETEAQNLTAYIPTNLISITDGQIYLSPDLFQKAQLPAIDVSRSVSRVGGKTQLPAYRAITGPLRLSYSQFEELEIFARFGTRLDPETRRTIDHGHRVREVLKQGERSARTPFEQIAELLAAVAGVYDAVPVDRVSDAAARVRTAVVAELPAIGHGVDGGQALTDAERDAIVATARRSVAPLSGGNGNGNA